MSIQTKPSSYLPNLQIITLQCVWGYKQKTLTNVGLNIDKIYNLLF